MRIRRVFWSLLAIAIGVYAGLCLVFLVFQRSFIYMPTPVMPAHAAAFTLDVPEANVRISSRPHGGPEALVYFGGNAEDVAYTVPELAEVFPQRAIYAMHYRGYSGSSGQPAEAALRSDARALFELVHSRHSDVIVVGRSLGSSLAIQVAAEEPVSRLVLITPFESILSIAKRTAPFLPMTANTGTALSGADLIFKGGTCLAKVCQKLTSARTPAISAGSAERSVGTTYCRSGVMRTAGVRA